MVTCFAGKQISAVGVLGFRIAGSGFRVMEMSTGDGDLRQKFTPSPWSGPGIRLHQRCSGTVAAT